MKLAFTDQARRDLLHIGDAIAVHNPLRALSFVDELEAKCFSLLENPLIYSKVPRHEGSGMRRVVHGNYLIFYRIDGEVIVILRMLHGSMDYDSVLFPDI